MRRICLAVFASGILLAPAFAEPLEHLTLLGHTLTIAKSEDGKSTQVLVNGMVLYENIDVVIDNVRLIEGVPVVLGWSSDGNADCAQRPFVLSVPTPGNARLDGPIEGCHPVSVHAVDEGLQFVQDATSTDPAQTWAWSIADGFKKIAND